MAIVHSYIRFSTKKQIDGDSYRRQHEMHAEWIEANGHTLSALTFHDKGVSGFRGKNRDAGKLGEFLEEIGRRVQPGDILLLENLDRLSRQGVSEAQPLFQGILKRGVDIVVLRPYEMYFTRDSLKDFVGLMIPLIYFHLAYTESKNKSDRIGASWKRKRESTDGKPIDGFAPSWLSWDKALKNWVPNEGAKAIRYIFEETAKGGSQKGIANRMNGMFEPIGRSGVWNSQYVMKILNDRSVLGERQHHRFTEEGERIPTGKPVVDYYPRVVDEALWDRAQAGRKSIPQRKGPVKDFVNLFVGLVTNVVDGHVMHVTRTQAPDGPVHRRFTSYGRIRSLPGACSVTFKYEVFEHFFLVHVSELKASDLEPKIDTALLKAKEQELSGISLRLEELQEAMSNPGKGSIRAILQAIEDVEERKTKVEEEVRILRSQMTADVPLAEAKKLHEVLQGLEGEELLEARSRLRVLIAELVEQILVKPQKISKRVFTEVEVKYRSGLSRAFCIGPAQGYSPSWSFDAKSPVPSIGTPEYEKIRFKGHTMWTWSTYQMLLLEEEKNRGASKPLPDIKPDPKASLGSNVERWLEQIRPTIRPDNFRMIPSKVRRFAEFLEIEKTKDLDGKAWQQYVRHLRLEIASKNATFFSARNTYSRAREFVRWLIEHGAVKPFDEIKVSGDKALKG